MNASPDAASALPTVTVDRVTRRLIGPGGRVVELPPLSIRLLEVLHASAPAFVASDQLEAAVWPDTHLSPDTLKQRVRLVRRALEEAGYDPAVLDSARGHGYALRATIVGPTSAPEPPWTVSAPVPPQIVSAPLPSAKTNTSALPSP